MTREELIERFVQRKAARITYTWADFVSAVGGLSLEQKEKLLSLVNSTAPSAAQALGAALQSVVQQSKKVTARQQVDVIVADGKVSIDELLELF